MGQILIVFEDEDAVLRHEYFQSAEALIPVRYMVNGYYVTAETYERITDSVKAHDAETDAVAMNPKHPGANVADAACDVEAK